MFSSHLERTSKKPFESSVAGVSHPAVSIDAQPTTKQTLIRRVTSKFSTIAVPARSGNQGSRSRATLPSDTTCPPTQGPRTTLFPTLPNSFISKEHREAALRERGLLPSKDLSEQEREADQRLDSIPPQAAIPVYPTLPNSFISKEHREAALRERGLLPRKDLSEQEHEADQRLVPALSPVSLTFDGATEAERFKASWLARNRASESNDAERGPSTPSPLEETTLPSSPVSPESDTSYRSCNEKTDVTPVGGHPFSSSDTSIPRY